MIQDIKKVKELRSELKNFIHDKIKNLSEHLEKLELKGRLDIMVKLMLLAMSKNNNISATYRERDKWDFD